MSRRLSTFISALLLVSASARAASLENEMKAVERLRGLTFKRPVIQRTITRAELPNVLRAQISLTFRVSGPHAIGLQFVESRRDPRFSGLPNLRQSVGALSLFYTFLGDEKFGVVRQ